MSAQLFQNRILQKSPGDTALVLLAGHLSVLESIISQHRRVTMFLSAKYFFPRLLGYNQAYQESLSVQCEAARRSLTEQVATISKIMANNLPSDEAQRIIMTDITDAFDAIAGIRHIEGRLISYEKWDDFLAGLPHKVPGLSVKTTSESAQAPQIKYHPTGTGSLVRVQPPEGEKRRSVRSAFKPCLRR